MNDLAINTDLKNYEADIIVDEPDLKIVENEESEPSHVIPLTTFIQDFGADLLNAVKRQNPPVYGEVPDVARAAIMDTMPRRPFDAQQRVVQAVTRLLVDENEKAAIINAEMGTGKVRRIGA